MFLNPLSRVEKKIRNESDKVLTVNPKTLESDDIAKSRPVSYRTINQYGGTTCRSSFSKVNPDTIGCVWTGEFDLNALPVDGEIFESEKKKLRIQNIQIRVEGDKDLLHRGAWVPDRQTAYIAILLVSRTESKLIHLIKYPKFTLCFES